MTSVNAPNKFQSGRFVLSLTAVFLLTAAGDGAHAEDTMDSGELVDRSLDELLNEVGYHMRNPEFQLDVSMFYNLFSHLRSILPGEPECQPGGQNPLVDSTCLFTSTHIEAPLNLGNDSNYDAMGVEVWVSKQLSRRWKLQGGYTYLRTTEEGGGSIGEQLEFPEDSPEHQVSLRSSTDINENLELDVLLRWVDELEFQGIDAYSALAFRLAWAPAPELSVAAVGRNLFAGDHVEFISELADLAPVQIEPEGFIELRWNF